MCMWIFVGLCVSVDYPRHANAQMGFSKSHQNEMWVHLLCCEIRKKDDSTLDFIVVTVICRVYTRYPIRFWVLECVRNKKLKCNQQNIWHSIHDINEYILYILSDGTWNWKRSLRAIIIIVKKYHSIWEVHWEQHRKFNKYVLSSLFITLWPLCLPEKTDTSSIYGTKLQLLRFATWLWWRNTHYSVFLIIHWEFFFP